MNLASLSRYWKTCIAVFGAVLVVGNSVLATAWDGYGDGKWDTQDSLAVAIAFVTAAGVYGKANRPPAGERSDPNVSETER